MKPDFETWYWCRRNGIRYVECDGTTGRIIHTWKSGNRARLKPTRTGTYICSTVEYIPVFFAKFEKEAGQ